jgi:hypothetical protein
LVFVKKQTDISINDFMIFCLAAGPFGGIASHMYVGHGAYGVATRFAQCRAEQCMPSPLAPTIFLQLQFRGSKSCCVRSRGDRSVRGASSARCPARS